MRWFGEEPPTRGEILFDQVIVLPEIINVLASQLVQTNTLLDSQTTNTHPSPPPDKRASSLGVSVSFLHFQSCDSLCQRMSNLHDCSDPCNSKFIFNLPASSPIRATVAVPCGLATWITIHTSAPGCKIASTAPSLLPLRTLRSRARASFEPTRNQPPPRFFRDSREHPGERVSMRIFPSRAT